MSRIPAVGPEALPAELEPLWAKFTGPYGDFTNQARVLAHAPHAFAHLYGLIDAWRRAGSLPQRLVEIAVVTTSRVNQCPYCVDHHAGMLIAHGLSAETVDSILEPDPPGLDERERAVRDYARLVTERAWGIRDSEFAGLQRFFDDTQIVELTVRIGLCSLFNKFNQALQIETEDGVTGVSVAETESSGR